MKNAVSCVMGVRKKKKPNKATGTLLSEPTIAYVVGPAAATQFNEAKFKKNPTKPAKAFLKK